MSPTIHAASCAGTRCTVPRMGQVRRISRRSMAANTSSATRPGARTPTDHNPLARSWACIAPNHSTTESGESSRSSPSRSERNLTARTSASDSVGPAATVPSNEVPLAIPASLGRATHTTYAGEMTPGWHSTNRSELAAVRAEIAGWIPSAADSPLYSSLATQILDDVDMLRLVGRIDNMPPLNLLFGAVQLLWGAPLAPVSYADFRDFVLANEDQIVDIGCMRRTQTNEARRAAVILPWVAQAATAFGDQPVHAIDIGASAGLVTCLDRFAYDYGSGVIGDSPLVLTCENRGGFDMPHAVPTFASRTALDLAPVDVDDPDQVAWLDALIWPEHTERRERFSAALAIRRATEVATIAGDAAETLGQVASAHPDGALLLFHTIALYQMPPTHHDALDDVIEGLAKDRELVRIAFEPPPGKHPDIRVSLRPRTAAPVATAHPHGAWVDVP